MINHTFSIKANILDYILALMADTQKNLSERQYQIELLRVALRENRIDVAEWFANRLKLTDDEVHAELNMNLINGCWSGNIATAQWTIDYFGYTEADVKANNARAFAATCQNGHLELAKYLAEKYRLTSDDVKSGDNYIILAAAKFGGNPEVLSWLVDEFKLSFDNVSAPDGSSAIGAAMLSDNIAAAQVLVDKFELKTCKLNDFIIACQLSSLDTVKWAVDVFKISEADFKNNEGILPTSALVNKRVEVAGWLFEQFNVSASDAKLLLASDKAELYNKESVDWVSTHYKLKMIIEEVNSLEEMD